VPSFRNEVSSETGDWVTQITLHRKYFADLGSQDQILFFFECANSDPSTLISIVMMKLDLDNTLLQVYIDHSACIASGKVLTTQVQFESQHYFTIGLKRKDLVQGRCVTCLSL
jgi:hypothetical protein